MAGKTICSACGAEYEENLAKCPYCDTLNFSGAEAEYMDKLGDVHDDMKALRKLPGEEIRRAFFQSGNYLKKVILGIAGAILVIAAIYGVWHLYQSRYDRYNSKESYIWEQENFPVLDRMYDEGKYDEMLDFISDAFEQGYAIYHWKHYDFYTIYNAIQYCQTFIDEDAKGVKLTQESCEFFLYGEWQIKCMELFDTVPEEEKAILLPLAEPILRDFDTRWNFTEEEYQSMYEEAEGRYGYVSFKTIEAYIKTWYKNYKND